MLLLILFFYHKPFINNCCILLPPLKDVILDIKKTFSEMLPSFQSSTSIFISIERGVQGNFFFQIYSLCPSFQYTLEGCCCKENKPEWQPYFPFSIILWDFSSASSTFASETVIPIAVFQRLRLHLHSEWCLTTAAGDNLAAN